MMERFSYQNTETKTHNGNTTVRKVYIKNGEGYKSVSKFKNGKKISTVKKPIHMDHIQKIKGGTFIQGLFRDCKHCPNNRTYKSPKKNNTSRRRAKKA